MSNFNCDSYCGLYLENGNDNLYLRCLMYWYILCCTFLTLCLAPVSLSRCYITYLICAIIFYTDNRKYPLSLVIHGYRENVNPNTNIITREWNALNYIEFFEGSHHKDYIKKIDHQLNSISPKLEEIPFTKMYMII